MRHSLPYAIGGRWRIDDPPALRLGRGPEPEQRATSGPHSRATPGHQRPPEWTRTTWPGPTRRSPGAVPKLTMALA